MRTHALKELMSYTYAKINKKTEHIDVVERVKGKRLYNSYPIDYSFYIDAPNGQYRSIFNTPLDKVVPKNRSEKHREVAVLKASNTKTWESDINPIFKCLSTHYRHAPVPDLHVALVDIETDYDSVRGFATVEDPFNMITSITLKLEWLNQLITLVVPPPTVNNEDAQKIAEGFENTVVFDSEVEMLDAFLYLIVEADVISGWNSEGYDLPYLVNRIAMIMSKNDTSRLCLWGELPKEKMVEKYGKESQTYELVGRTHLDMLELYRKFTYEERHSYSLNAIADYELGKSKTPYEGSLDDLYKKDFRKFIEYNRQDVILLSELEAKFKLIALVNGLAHDTTTLMTTCMGTVGMVDQAIINRTHDLGFIVHDKIDHDIGNGAVGAYVAPPKEGIHQWVGVIDINSLYPSTIRALNMGIETIVGQLRPTMSDHYLSERLKEPGMTFASAWEGIFGTLEYQAVMSKNPDIDITIDWEHSNTNDVITAEECYRLIFESDMKWMLSGNGTIFTYERSAVIPGLLAEWYRERKEFQKKMAEATNLVDQDFYNRRQHIRKIVLNSTYGCTLSPHSRFYDARFGQSVTLTGRSICKHMNSFVNQCITGEYKIDGDSIITADTDSSQFSAWSTVQGKVASGEIPWNRDIVVELYLAIGDKVNASFPDFMSTAFHCPREFGELIKGSCESVGERALYITKKRYAILNYFKDGKRYDGKEKLKAMGLDLRRSDTPVICQKFLKDILMELLQGGTEDRLVTMINDFKQYFKQLPLHEQGTPKRVNGLTNYVNLIKAGKGNRVPGHVRAAINWNTLREANKDNVSNKITDGTKCIVCPLRTNTLNMTSIAYPIDEAHLPTWFTELPFDHDGMIAAVVDKKIENLFSALSNWKVIEDRTTKNSCFDEFFT